MGDIFKFARLVYNGVCKSELLEICVFCQKPKENKTLKKYSHGVTKSLCEKGRKGARKNLTVPGEKERATLNLPEWLSLVNNMQETSICCFR